MLGFIPRPPGIAWLAGLLFAAGWLIKATHTPPGVVVGFVAGPIAALVPVIVPLLPYLILGLGILALVFLLAKQREHATEAGIGAVALFVFALIWHLTPFGAWVTAHAGA